MKEKRMSIEDMKNAKTGWQRWQKVAKHILRDVQNMSETEKNRWELKSLEMSYIFFVEQISKIVSVYGKLINLAEFNELKKDDFALAMREVQRINKDLNKEQSKPVFILLNNKYVHNMQDTITEGII